MKTYYAPPQRDNPDEILLENQEIISLDFIRELTTATNNFFMILNDKRQIVFANVALLKLLGLHSELDAAGKRPGEALNCKNANLMEAGCGTSQFCSQCGAVHAILAALDGKESEKECRIVTSENSSFDLAIKTKPFLFNDHKYIILSAIDISDTKRREILEQVFFHDILNTAGGLMGLAEIMMMNHTEDDSFETIYSLSDKLVKEIQSQRLLLEAENDNLELDPIEINLKNFLNDIKKLTENNDAINHISILINCDSSINIETDSTLLQRVLINMVKNAAEASNSGDTITLAGKTKKDTVITSVHNPTYMSEEVQLQVFQRSFSTKGTARGIGTYSMKLFGEKYLKGTVDFNSNKTGGTTFFINLPKTIN